MASPVNQVDQSDHAEEADRSTEHTADKSSPTVTTSTTRTPSISIGTDHTSPMSTHAVPAPLDSRSKMTISSLLDAAAVIESSTKRKLPEDDLPPSPKKHCSSNMEDSSCDTWDLVESNFVHHVAAFLDALLATSRFSSMPIQGMAKMSDLPPDGNGTVTIPSTGTTTSSGKASPKFDNSPDASCTVRVGQNIATLEAVRQMLSILCPNFYLETLSIDEGSVTKLEELRTSNDYRLLRAIVQLISSTKDTQFLPIADKDHHLMLCIQALHRFITSDSDLSHAGHSSLISGLPALDTTAIFQTGLANCSTTDLWSILLLVASPSENLSLAQEEELVEFAAACPTDHTLRVPLLLGAHYYLLTRRPQKQMALGRDSNLRLLLLETCSSGTSNVVLRRLVNMMLN